MIRLSASDARRLGLTAPAKQDAKSKQSQSSLAVLFMAGLHAHHLPAPLAEYQFAKPRKWAFDYAWPMGDGLALEIQGGLFTGGRHVRGAALLKEQEKLCEAAIRGWRVLFCVPDDVKTGKVFAILKRALENL